VRVLNQPNSLVWTELLCTDAEKATEFYTKLFGWTVVLRDSVVKDQNGPVTYTTFMRGETPAAGMLQMTSEIRMRSQWLPYFGVADVDTSHGKIKQSGGFEVVPPTDVPNVGRFSVAQDPQGASFGLLGH